MSLSVSPNLSALQALGKKQSVIANNIANGNSKEFKKSRVSLEDGENGTVSARLQEINTAGVKINQPDGTLEELSNVDLGLELAEMIPTQRGYEANLKAVKSQDEMEASVIDLMG